MKAKAKVIARYNGHEPQLEQEIALLAGKEASDIRVEYPALPDKKALRRVGVLEFACDTAGEAEFIAKKLHPLSGVEIYIA